MTVVTLANQSRATEWPDEQRVAFETLSDQRQAAFERSLDGGQLRFERGKSPFDFNNKSRPRLVHYRGIWYYVRVTIV